MELLTKPHAVSIPSSCSFDELELTLVRYARQAVEELLTALVEQVERDWLSSSVAVGYQSKGWQTRVVSTVLGELPLRRRKFYNPKTRRTLIPVDGLLSVGRETSAVKEFAVRLASEVSFAKASHFLQLALDIQRSPKRVWKDLQEAGRQLDERTIEDTEHMYKTGEVLDCADTSHPILAVEADGTFVKGRTRGESLEVKLAIAYTQKQTKGTRRRLLQNKHAWAGVLSSEEFGKRLAFSLEREYSLSTVGRLVCRSDGADWIAKVFEELPVRGAHQLDLHHLVRNITDSVKDMSVQVECLWYAYDGNGEALLRQLKDHVSEIQDDRSRVVVQRLVKYVTKNIDRIDCLAAYRQATKTSDERSMYCRGSGAIERNISLFICDRMKHRRMHWSASGANHMAHVRAALASQPGERIIN